MWHNQHNLDPLYSLAKDRHQALLDDAASARVLPQAEASRLQPLRQLRHGTGDLLVTVGLWLKSSPTTSPIK